MKTAKILKIAAAGVLALAVVAAVVVFPADEYLARFLEWVRSTGVWGPVLLAAAYVIACVLFMPGSILTLGAGFLFGVIWGTVTVSIGSVLGATVAFLIGRTLLRGWIGKKIAAYRGFDAIDRAIGKQGFKIVLLVRLSPIFPFNLLNYAFGITKVRLQHYVLASWLGMLPGTLMYVYLGSAFKSLAQTAAGANDGGGMRTAFFAVGLLMTVVATIVVARIAKRALDEAVDGPVIDRDLVESGAESKLQLQTPVAGDSNV